MANYHVTKNRSNGWNIKKAGADRVSKTVATQKEAQQLAKQYSGNSGGGEVRIHGVDGKIRDSDTVPPGIDPHPPEDKKH